MSEMVRPRVLVVMGVSGSGKSSIALRLRDELGWPFQEGDELHPKANVTKMAAGTPLTDEDRAPWLDICAGWIRERLKAGTGGLLTCSALRRVYRQRLGEGLPGLHFLYLKVPEEVLRARLAQRRGHYMPPSLLGSQLRTLEEPTSEEPALVVPVEQTVDQTATDVITVLRRLDEQAS